MRPAVFVAVLVVLAATGCRTTVDVGIAGDGTGGGTVTVTVRLDREALAAAGGPDAIALDDLEGTGWVIGKPGRTDGGGYQLVARHAFADTGELQGVLDSLAGPGVFRDVASLAEDGFARSSAELSTRVEVTGDPAQFSDEALTKLLGGRPLGYTPEELAFMGATKPGAATMAVSVSVPGGQPDTAELDLTAGEPTSVVVASSGSQRDLQALLMLGAGVVLVVAGLVVAVRASVRRGAEGT